MWYSDLRKFYAWSHKPHPSISFGDRNYKLFYISSQLNLTLTSRGSYVFHYAYLACDSCALDELKSSCNHYYSYPVTPYVLVLLD